MHKPIPSQKKERNVARMINWGLCRKRGLERAEMWQTNFRCHCWRQLQDFMRCHDLFWPWSITQKIGIIIVLVVIKKKEHASSWQETREQKDKNGNYEHFKRKVCRIWSMEKVEIIPIFLAALETISTELQRWLKKIVVNVKTGHLQRTKLLGTARILRNFFDSGWKCATPINWFVDSW